jgi:uncharacterized protein YegP (UPF0339 family)
VRDNAGNDARYERREAINGELYFVLKAGNGEIIGTSETYRSNSSVVNGIAAVKANAPVAGVER